MKPRLRVCLASVAPFLGGAEVAAERLALGLQEAGHDVLVVLGSGGTLLDRMQLAGLKCVHRPMYSTDKWHPWRYIQARDRIRHLLRRHEPDVIHSNDLPTHQIISDAARGLGIPRICHHRFPFDGAALDWLNKYGAERHLFVSGALMDDLCRESDRLRESPRAVVHDGIPLPPRPDRDDRNWARARLGLPVDRTIAVFVGQVIEVKGVADLIRAWALLDAATAGRSELVIVGDDVRDGGRYRFEMEALARALGCPARLVGFQEDVWTWFRASDLAIVPSHVEPLGLVVLEAMACELPVIGCAVGGIKETVLPEETGLLIPPHSPEHLAAALARLLVDGATRHRFGERGRRRCEEHFSLQAHVGHVLDEYRWVLKSANRPLLL
jgi:glycosyltransferase involved in cell wall biosynthesis